MLKIGGKNYIIQTLWFRLTVSMECHDLHHPRAVEQPRKFETASADPDQCPVSTYTCTWMMKIATINR